MNDSLASLLGASALALATGIPSPLPSPVPSPLLPAAATVHIKDFAFNPTPLRIHPGDRVTFVNDDDDAHTATATDRSFDSEGLDGHAVWQHVFSKPGTYTYFCQLHPYMKALIIVAPARVTNAKGAHT